MMGTTTAKFIKKRVRVVEEEYRHFHRTTGGWRITQPRFTTGSSAAADRVMWTLMFVNAVFAIVGWVR